MQRRSPCRRKGQGACREAQHSSAAALEDLQQRFEAFHHENRRCTRVPIDLRRAAVAAVSQGVTPTSLQRTGHVSTTQLQRWQAIEPERAARSSCTEVAPARRPYRDRRSAGEALELRVGAWSVCVRLAAQEHDEDVARGSD
jgi:hypothetical protein